MSFIHVAVQPMLIPIKKTRRLWQVLKRFPSNNHNDSKRSKEAIKIHITYIQRGKTRVKAGKSRLCTKVTRVFLANRSVLGASIKVKKIEYYSFDCPTSFLLFPLFSLSLSLFPPPPTLSPLPPRSGGEAEEKPGNEVSCCGVKTKLNQHS